MAELRRARVGQASIPSNGRRLTSCIGGSSILLDVYCDVYLHDENRVRSVKLHDIGIVEPMPVGAEVAEPEAGAAWQGNCDRSCAVGSTAHQMRAGLPPIEITDHTASINRLIMRQREGDLYICSGG